MTINQIVDGVMCRQDVKIEDYGEGYREAYIEEDQVREALYEAIKEAIYAYEEELDKADIPTELLDEIREKLGI